MTAQLTSGLRTLVVSAVPGARPPRLRQSAEAGGASVGHQPSHGVALHRDMLGGDRPYAVDGSGLHGDDIVIADIRDRARIDQVFAGLRPQVVFHDAAPARGAAGHRRAVRHRPGLELPCLWGELARLRFHAERVDSEPAFAHTGRPLPAPGTHRTSSDVCVYVPAPQAHGGPGRPFAVLS
ncbi:hypothetical protein ACIQ6Y_35430 [Streptomyces sp. NPDC096205]|uniref:hypothetical protein n=1 Tax=Streptomyces sp. NPDC096205 TaxID=3366081 RepID=UPI00381661C5